MGLRSVLPVATSSRNLVQMALHAQLLPSTTALLSHMTPPCWLQSPTVKKRHAMIFSTMTDASPPAPPHPVRVWNDRLLVDHPKSSHSAWSSAESLIDNNKSSALFSAARPTDSVEELMARACVAREEFAKLSQTDVDRIFLAVAHAADKQRVPLAQIAVGTYETNCRDEKCVFF